MVFDSFFQQVLEMNPATVVLGVSLFLSVLITFVYKWMTDQTVMKSLKDDISKMQEQMKKNRDNPKKILELQKVAMEKNMQYMTKSMKPTLITFIPLILVFGWLNAHYTYDNIMPGAQFSIIADFKEGTTGIAKISPVEGIEVVDNVEKNITDNKASWRLKGKEGTYLVQVEYDGMKYDKEVVISQTHNYAAPVKPFKEEKVLSVNIDSKKLRVFGEDFNIFGWHPGWLGTYVLTSVILSMILRKAMNLY